MSDGGAIAAFTVIEQVIGFLTYGGLCGYCGRVRSAYGIKWV
jgi:hypothetical protein